MLQSRCRSSSTRLRIWLGVTRMGRGLERPQNIEPLGNLFCLIEMDVGPTVRIRSAPASSHCELCSIDEMRKALLLTYESANGLSRAMGGGARRPPHGRVGVPIRTNHPPGMNAIVQSPRASVDTTLNTLNGALASAQAQAQDFQAEEANLQQLELRNQTAIGNLQAIQVSNEIALAQVQQVQMLRQLVMAEIDSQNVAAANQVNDQTQSSLAAQAFFGALASPGTPSAFQSAPSPPQP